MISVQEREMKARFTRDRCPQKYNICPTRIRGLIVSKDTKTENPYASAELAAGAVKLLLIYWLTKPAALDNWETLIQKRPTSWLVNN